MAGHTLGTELIMRDTKKDWQASRDYHNRQWKDGLSRRSCC